MCKVVKTTFTVVFIFFCLALAQPATAQQSFSDLDMLTVDIWPDYDQPSVLVLLTGTLPPETPLPAAVQLPLPPEAALNVVARIDSNRVMSDDIEFGLVANGVTFTTPDRSFRVEYYLPYLRENGRRSYQFRWQAAFDVAQMVVRVQQPAAAEALQLVPTAVSVAEDARDGFLYHTLPPLPVAANEVATVTLSYELTTEQLSVNLPQNLESLPVAAEPARSFDWGFFLAGMGIVILLTAVAWQLFVVRTKPRRSKSKRVVAARYCHECGRPLIAGNNFCRTCGTAVKTK